MEARLTHRPALDVNERIVVNDQLHDVLYDRAVATCTVTQLRRENYLWLCASGAAASAELQKAHDDVVEDNKDIAATTAALSVRTYCCFSMH